MRKISCLIIQSSNFYFIFFIYSINLRLNSFESYNFNI